MKAIFTLLTIFCLCLSAIASVQDDLEAKYNIGIQHYEARNYRSALASFQEILNTGYENKYLYYNMGNAAFRLNKYALSVWCYNKALILDPSMNDAQFNLEIVQQKVTNIIEPAPIPWHRSVIRSISQLLSTDGWAISAFIVLCLLVVSIVIFLLSATVVYRKLMFWTSVGLLSVFIVFFGFAIKTYYSTINPSKGVVIIPATGVKSEPNTQAVDVFTIHEGNIVTISDRAGDWLEIESPNGESGWLMKNALMEL